MSNEVVIKVENLSKSYLIGHQIRNGASQESFREAISRHARTIAKAALDMGFVISFSGNGGINGPYYPAGCQNVVAVGATDSNDTVAYWSNYGSFLSLVAPGVDLQVFTERPTGALRKRLALGDAGVVVFAGRLERLKGAETVIRAMAHLASDRAQAQPPVLLVIGDDSQNGASESATSGGERRASAAKRRMRSR